MFLGDFCSLFLLNIVSGSDSINSRLKCKKKYKERLKRIFSKLKVFFVVDGDRDGSGFGRRVSVEEE